MTQQLLDRAQVGSPSSKCVAALCRRPCGDRSGVGAHTQERGVEVVRCPAVGACGAPRTVPEVGYNYPYVFLGPFGTAKLFWDAGCRGEACYSTSVRYIDGR